MSVTGRLAGRSAVVTGAARGIGRAIAERFLAEGARVACLDASGRRLEATIGEMGGSSANLRGYEVDVSRRDDVARVFGEIETDLGPVGALVNNAVWARYQPLADLDEDTLDRMLAVGLKALFWTTQAALPQMRRAGAGSIVNICSTAAHRVLANAAAYSAMKAAVAGLTRAAAVELGREGIRVNAVTPGMIGTPASVANYDAGTLAARQNAIPARRFGEPAEIADAVLFLACGESAYVQGQEIVVDGGWTVAAS